MEAAKKEKQEIVADPSPCAGNNDKSHRLTFVQNVVPVIAQEAQVPCHDTNAGVEHEKPQHTSHGGGHGIRPDEKRAIRARPLDQAVRENGEI